MKELGQLLIICFPWHSFVQTRKFPIKTMTHPTHAKKYAFNHAFAACQIAYVNIKHDCQTFSLKILSLFHILLFNAIDFIASTSASTKSGCVYNECSTIFSCGRKFGSCNDNGPTLENKILANILANILKRNFLQSGETWKLSKEMCRWIDSNENVIILFSKNSM